MSIKIKVSSLEIVVSGPSSHPYYSIKYFDLSDNSWHEGYSSYYLDFVLGWKDKCFEVVEDLDLQPVRHGSWICTGSSQVCSECDEYQPGYDNFRNYCANCGAKMDKPPIIEEDWDSESNRTKRRR